MSRNLVFIALSKHLVSGFEDQKPWDRLNAWCFAHVKNMIMLADFDSLF